uniref:Uncharacterized protein n=1 Tax=Ananas comosus var. bracteatus TaxID=296719 RepID=A0A6V7P099_ANACO|nr:unnamed protein product [Ananas comosus var. bracteatus]
MGPIGVKKHLAPFLPSHPVFTKEKRLGRFIMWSNGKAARHWAARQAPPRESYDGVRPQEQLRDAFLAGPSDRAPAGRCSKLKGKSSGLVASVKESGVAKEALASISKKTSSVGQLPLKTSEESLRKSEDSKGVTERLDNISKKLKQKITWADHKGGSISSCCPLDADALPASPIGPRCHPPPSSLAREGRSSGRWRIKETSLGGRFP